MAKVLMVKSLGSLRPADVAGEEMLSKIAMGKFVTVEIKQPRNIKHLRLYWALVGIVWENIDGDRYPTTDDLHAAIKISAGLRTRIELPDGTVGFIPGSIAFDKMEQVEFDQFFNKVCDLVAKYFLPGVSSEALRNEVMQMTGLAA